jgi:23S rRNA pseudouridine1911/1915/1917 synthase
MPPIPDQRSGFKPVIYYEDNHLLVVHKPANMPVQQDQSGDADLLSALREYIRVKYNKPGNVFLGLVHRLDRPVQGVMVFARTSKAASRLSEQFRSRAVTKKYLVVVEGNADEEARLEHDLEKNEATNIVKARPAGSGKGKTAVLTYRLTGFHKGLSRLEVELETGRPHQIRVQLAAARLPVWGDYKYGSKQPEGRQIALLSWMIGFDHPTRPERLQFSAEIPTGEPWALFG